MRPRCLALAGVMLLTGALSYAVFAPPRGPRSIRHFDAARTADLELNMWQAYYARQNLQLYVLLVQALRAEYHYSWAVAAIEAFHLARAAVQFGNLRAGYESVLPDLESAYTQAQSWLRAPFDPEAVARAELAWWVARRTPGADSAEHVGSLMADEYALLYDMPREQMAEPARLRAEAAALRDKQAANPDWEAIGRLLRESYAELLRALSSQNA